MIHIGLLGFGTVGQGVYEIIAKHQDSLSIKKILVRDTNKKRATAVPSDLLTDQIETILGDDEISVVISVMGGKEPEYTYIKQALNKQKNVVTANKEIIAAHMDELLALAKENGVSLFFEASVGGGIPIIESLVETLKINHIDKIHGILNGTTNFILTKMSEEQKNFGEILALAQQMGFAEADPTADIDGYDVMRKISILASIAFETMVDEKDIHRRGIGNITLDDIKMANRYGYHVKYVGKAVLSDDNTYSVSVSPVLLKENSVLSNVNEEYNMVMIEGDIIGQLCFMGKGAGKKATANAVVSDVLKIVNGNDNYNSMQFERNLKSRGIKGIENEYYLRVTVNDYKELSKAVNLIADTVERNQMIYADGKLYLLTEKIPAEEMKRLHRKLMMVADDAFYARLEDRLL